MILTQLLQWLVEAKNRIMSKMQGENALPIFCSFFERSKNEPKKSLANANSLGSIQGKGWLKQPGIFADTMDTPYLPFRYPTGTLEKRKDAGLAFSEA